MRQYSRIRKKPAYIKGEDVKMTIVFDKWLLFVFMISIYITVASIHITFFII